MDGLTRIYADDTDQEQTTAEAKYRGLSAAAAKCASFGRDDVCFGVGVLVDDLEGAVPAGEVEDGVHSAGRLVDAGAGG